MIGHYPARLTGSKRNLLALLASSVIFSAGCANMSSTAPVANSLSSPATLSGKVHGGNQPVVGAAVTLWYMGQTSGTSGTPATKAATTTTDSSGSFSFTKGAGGNGTTSTYTCPTTVGDPVVYVVSQGGNTQNNGGSSTNSAAAFIAIYGSCASLSASNSVYMSEVTTVATMAAIQQFFDPTTDTLSADGTGQQRAIVGNLPNTIALLADSTTGLAVPSTTTTGVGVSLTATPETAKVNTLANIISACINGATSADPSCGTLFASAVPPAASVTNLNPSTPFATATDTLQALYYIFTNPTNTPNGSTPNLGALFGLQTSVGAPYVPALASAPTDWSIGISYGSSSTCGTGGNFISSPTDINIDGQDNVWFGNAQTGGNLSSISAAGAPLQCVNFDAGLNGPGGTIDSAGNVWSAGPATLYRYNPSTQAKLAFPVTVGPLAITADGVGNIYFTAVAGSVGSLYQLPGAATAGGVVLPVQISSTVGASPLRLMPDFQGIAAPIPPATVGIPNPVNIWVTSGTNSVAEVSPSTASGNLNGFITTPHTTSGNSWGISVTKPGGVFVSSLNSSVIDYGLPPSYGSAPGFPFTAAASAGINGPKGVTIDGRLNLWIPNANAASVSEISAAGVALSPATGFAKATSYLNANSVTAVDQAGNVWVVGTGNTFVTEIVGEGVPLFAPYAVGLTNSRFQTIP
jgi:hypothetical protein